MTRSAPRRLLEAIRSCAVSPGPSGLQGWFRGPFSTWDEAGAASTGYDSSAILGKILAAARLVRDGKASFERDSVVFHVEDVNWPVLASLLLAASRRDGYLHVLDFGGSLGSLYFQHRRFLSHLSDFRWGIVEQPAVVRAGAAELEDGALQFFPSVTAASAGLAPNVVLAAAVLQYLPNPYTVLAELATVTSDLLVLDRTSVVSNGPATLTVQSVPDEIYRASYPCWFLEWDRLAETLLPTFGPVATFDSQIEPPIPLPTGQQGRWRGATFQRRQQIPPS